MSQLDVPEWVIEPVQSSLHDVTKYGTAASNFIGFPYDIAGKTGTAENSQGRDFAIANDRAQYLAQKNNPQPPPQ